MTDIQRFDESQVKEAWRWAFRGGQALLVYDDTPKDARGVNLETHKPRWAGRLYDRKRERLIETAKRLGLPFVFFDHAGTNKQSVKLYGEPLRKAVAEASKTEAGE